MEGKLKDKIVFGENGRSNATYYSNDLEEIGSFVNEGWKFELDYNGKGVWLRSPDIWLVDLSDIQKINYYGNPIINLAYFNYLNELIKSNNIRPYIKKVICKNKIYYNGFEFEISSGLVLETEVRILGSDTRLNTLKKDLFQDFYESKEYKQYFNDSKKFLGKTEIIKQSHIPFEDQDKSIREFYKNIQNLYNGINDHVEYYPKIINNFIEQLPPHDNLVLIPSGCFKYLSSLLSKENIDKIMFWEFHVNKHIKKNVTLFKKDLKNKNVLIIDNLYSGKTMDHMSNLIKKKGGNPIRLGLFPKSAYSIRKTDYVFFIDRVIKTTSINPSKEWYLELYKKVLKVKRK
ncbi:MAG: hypothetical protein KAQ83_01770 [Nanoarchaeota archaeon]|nr:hypothetical protein [Nanoarchaeota archaeon]